MRKEGTDPDNVQMSDVLCDFCERQWAEDIPMMEGHQGSCICGRCLTVAYTEVAVERNPDSPTDYACPMCLESASDRVALNRADEPGWRSPLRPDAVICRRCIKLAVGALAKDPDFNWTRPST